MARIAALYAANPLSGVDVLRAMIVGACGLALIAGGHPLFG